MSDKATIDEIRAAHFPAALAGDFTARAVEADVLWQVTAELDRQIETPFDQLGLYQMPKARRQQAQPLRRLYGRVHHEYFVFYSADDEPAGWSYGHMVDEATFFMSWSGVGRRFQRKGLYTTFLQRLLPYLHQLGYERVTSKHMVNNRPVLIAKLKAGFNILGMSLDERYGAQVTLGYFFHEERRQTFTSAFSLDPAFNRRG